VAVILPIQQVRQSRLDADIHISTWTDLPAVKKLAPNQKVRTSKQDRTLDSMFPVSHPSQQAADTGQQPSPAKIPEIEPSTCNLASVLQLREEVTDMKHEGMVDASKLHRFNENSFHQ
jgi:DNA mismatch repair protein MLH1